MELFGKEPELTGLWFAKETAAILAGEHTEKEGDSLLQLERLRHQNQICVFGGVQHWAHAFPLTSGRTGKPGFTSRMSTRLFFLTVCFCHPWEPSR